MMYDHSFFKQVTPNGYFFKDLNIIVFDAGLSFIAYIWFSQSIA